jgi:hypothetical protein
MYTSPNPNSNTSSLQASNLIFYDNVGTNKIEIVNNASLDEPFVRLTKRDPDNVATFYSDNLAMIKNGVGSTNLYPGDFTVQSNETNKDININAYGCQISLNQNGDTPTYGYITENGLTYSKTYSQNRIELNNSPDLVNDFYPYLRIKSEDANYKYTSNLTSEGHRQTLKDYSTDDLLFQIDVKPTEISFTNNSTGSPSVYTGGISAFNVIQAVDTTTASLTMDYGNRLHMTYTDNTNPNTREIDIFNDKDNEPYIKVVGSDASETILTSNSLNCPLIKNTGGTIEINGTQINLDATTIDLQNTSTTTSASTFTAEIKANSNGLSTANYLKVKLNGSDIWIPYFTTDPSL